MPEPLVMTLHVLGGMAWIGGALFFIFGLETDEQLRLAGRFGQFAWPAILLTFATGIANLARIGLSQLGGSVEGTALLTKIAASSLMLVDALAITFVVNRSLYAVGRGNEYAESKQLAAWTKRAQYMTLWTLTLIVIIVVALGFMMG